MADIVLASASPRRAELLRQIGVDFTVHPADVDESVEEGESPQCYVERLAREKAMVVAGRLSGDELVIGSDTSVVLLGEILGKPDNHDDAVAMLGRLSGASHQVMTGVAVVRNGLCKSTLVVTDVRFRELSEPEVEAYVFSGEPMDKAGSYGIQGLGGIFVREIRGSYSAVVGLPLQETAALIAEAGVPVWENWPRRLENRT
ncbi:septum formation inhibitor Maf [Marinobacter salinexigens]|uniref:dTTP/UTP pyrophosphatase n=1 Tax=Marinobacter salinexigens TaxID=2919747 RepID=A0A5B0VRF6_9GAMM|nr:Maf family protein [Marinobacter salinexigens]KAA1176349.1 septum formation inhibitor Maf [Marinobacter salinexigens]